MRTVWLASYPKSGNTWFRMLVANLSATDRAVDINDLPERGGIASARGPFDFLTLIDSDLLTHDEIDLLRPRVYEELARGEADDEYDAAPAREEVRFVKTHDAYTYTSAGEPLLGGLRGADAAIMIVRDPRDVAPSLANHNRTSIDEAIAFMNNPGAAFCGRSDRVHNQLRQQSPAGAATPRAGWRRAPFRCTSLVTRTCRPTPRPYSAARFPSPGNPQRTSRSNARSPLRLSARSFICSALQRSPPRKRARSDRRWRQRRSGARAPRLTRSFQPRFAAASAVQTRAGVAGISN